MPSASCGCHRTKPSRLSLTDVLLPDQRRSSKSQYYIVRTRDGPPHLFFNTNSNKVTSRSCRKDPSSKDKVEKGKSEKNGKNEDSKNGHFPGKGAVKDKARDNAAENKGPRDGLTPKQDAKLRHMKLAGKTWKEISEVVGRSPSTLKARWKEIKPLEAGQKGATKESSGKHGSKGKKEAAKKERARDKCKERMQDKDKSKADRTRPSSVASVRSVSTSNRSFASSDIRGRTIDEVFAMLEADTGVLSVSESKLLHKLVREDNKETALRIASRFFDVSGRRLHEDDVGDRLARLG